jgi:hypothetical protein
MNTMLVSFLMLKPAMPLTALFIAVPAPLAVLAWPHVRRHIGVETGVDVTARNESASGEARIE